MTKEQIEAIDALYARAPGNAWHLFSYEGYAHERHKYSLCTSIIPGDYYCDSHECLGDFAHADRDTACVMTKLVAALHNSWPAIRAALLSVADEADVVAIADEMVADGMGG